jgi:hypothetical protein
MHAGVCFRVRPSANYVSFSAEPSFSGKGCQCANLILFLLAQYHSY